MSIRIKWPVRTILCNKGWLSSHAHLNFTKMGQSLAPVFA